MDTETPRTADRPSGFLLWCDNLMPYWTPDGRSIEEIWRDKMLEEMQFTAEADNDDDEIPF